MKTICVVPCGSKKIWDKNPNAGPTKARHVYIGPFAKKCREYAERFYPESWYILSAKYGFLHPEDIIPESYNVSFNDSSTRPITLDELNIQKSEKGLDTSEKVVVLGGKNYVRMIEDLFPALEIVTPLSDCKGIGYMMGKISEMIRQGRPI